MDKTANIKSAGPGPVIYCGPNLGGSGLLQYTIYKQELPEHLNSQFANCPEVKELFIPVEELAKVQAEIKQPGTIFYRLYQIVQAFSQKGAI
jgi:hypothetical protein